MRTAARREAEVIKRAAEEEATAALSSSFSLSLPPSPSLLLFLLLLCLSVCRPPLPAFTVVSTNTSLTSNVCHYVLSPVLSRRSWTIRRHCSQPDCSRRRREGIKAIKAIKAAAVVLRDRVQGRAGRVLERRLVVLTETTRVSPGLPRLSSTVAWRS